MVSLQFSLCVLCICASYFASSLPHILKGSDIVEEPEFCHQLECPRYTVLQNDKTYELRRYLPSMWVATQVKKMDYSEQDRKESFDKLFNYISGNNTAHMKIPMTAPVLNTVLHGQGPDCESTFIMHFMIPFELQKSPPTPTANDVTIKSLQQMDVYVRVFGGYLNGSAIASNLMELANDINDTSKYMENPYYDAGYDNPFQILNRHNEVWLQAK